MRLEAACATASAAIALGIGSGTPVFAQGRMVVLSATAV